MFVHYHARTAAAISPIFSTGSKRAIPLEYPKHPRDSPKRLGRKSSFLLKATTGQDAIALWTSAAQEGIGTISLPHPEELISQVV